MVLREATVQNGDDREVGQDGQRSAVSEKRVFLGVRQDVQQEDWSSLFFVSRHDSSVHILLEASSAETTATWFSAACSSSEPVSTFAGFLTVASSCGTSQDASRPLLRL